MREPTVVGTESNGGSVGSIAQSPPPQALLERLKDYGQEDAFALWDELSPDERDHLVKDIEVVLFFFYWKLPFYDLFPEMLFYFTFGFWQSLDLPRVDRIIRCSLRSQGYLFISFLIALL